MSRWGRPSSRATPPSATAPRTCCDFVREKCGDVPVSSVRAGDRLDDAHGWVVVNAESYDDLDAVVRAVRASGRRFLYRTGPSFVRSLAGIEPIAPLTDFGRRDGHGLLVVGSHVGLTTRQVEAVEGLHEVELDVTALDPEGVGAQVAEALRDQDVLLYTSRELVRGDDPLATARKVSAAVTEVVRAALDARPAWVIAKGGITSHDVAVHGLGIRRATVLGQLLPGMVSVFRPRRGRRARRRDAVRRVRRQRRRRGHARRDRANGSAPRCSPREPECSSAAAPWPRSRRTRSSRRAAIVRAAERLRPARPAVGGRELLRRRRPRAAGRGRAGRGARRERAGRRPPRPLQGPGRRSTPASRSATAR